MAEAAIEVEERTGCLFDRRFWPLSLAQPVPSAAIPEVEQMIRSDDGRPIATGPVPDDGRDRPRGAIPVARSIDGDIAWTVHADPDVILGKGPLNARIGDKEYVCRAAPYAKAGGAIWWQDGEVYF